jgi:hypothetical protein
LRGIPCFLCDWLESSPYGYVDQFTRFGVGIPLHAPDQISQIPRMLEQRRSEVPREKLWTPIQAERLRTLWGLAQEREGAVESERVS